MIAARALNLMVNCGLPDYSLKRGSQGPSARLHFQSKTHERALVARLGLLSAATLAALPLPSRADSGVPSDAYAMPALSDNSELIARVVADLPRQIVTQYSRALPLNQAMREAQVPSVSVAVFVDGRLAWAQAWGYAEPVSKRLATPETLYQAASISKPVTALAAMKLVESGALGLDQDVSEAIAGWRASNPITLRQLLSHTSGLSVSGFGGYPVGTPLPTPLQILQGEFPSNSPPVVSTMRPGEAFRYSGGGYIAAQILVAQASGKPFADTLDGTVLAPLGMTHSTFSQPLELAVRKNAAKAYGKGKPVPGGANTYPELAAAGLWSTPSDIGRFAVDVQSAQRGFQSLVVTPEIAKAMLTQQVGGYGLGFDLNTMNGLRVFEHAGLNRGFESRFVASAEETGPRYIIAVMTNGEGGTAIADGLIRSVAREYQWRAFAPVTVSKVTVSRSDLADYVGLYRVDERTVGIELFKGELYVRDEDWRRGLMIPTGDAEFMVDNRSGVYRFARSLSGEPVALTIERGTSPLRFQRMPDVGKSQQAIAIHLKGTPTAATVEAFLTPQGDSAMLTSVRLEPGRYAFRISDARTKTVNLGASLRGSDVRLGRRHVLAHNGGDLMLTVDQSETYRFELRTSKGGRPQIKVTIAQTPSDE